MRRAILAPLGSSGDVNPFLWIGRVLRDRGIDVHVAVNPHHGRIVEAAGLDWLPVGEEEDYEMFVRNPNIWHPRKGPPLVFRAMSLATRPQFETISKFVGEDTVVFAPLTGFGARLAREKYGLRLITVHLQPSVMLSAEAPPFAGRGLDFIGRLPRTGRRAFFAVVRTIINFQAAPRVARICREVGVRPPRDLVGEWWHSPDGVICLFPEWFAKPQIDWPKGTQCVGFPLYDCPDGEALDPEVEQLTSKSTPTFLFSPGTAMAFGREFFKTAAEVCRRNGWQAIFGSKYRDQIPRDLPPGILVRDYVPFSLLMPKLAAVVHHGGIGTVAQGLAAGVPQLLMALSHDQPDNGNRIRALGCGDFLYPDQFTPTRVSEMLTKLITNPSYRQAAAGIRSRIETENPKEAFVAAVQHLTQPGQVLM